MSRVQDDLIDALCKPWRELQIGGGCWRVPCWAAAGWACPPGRLSLAFGSLLR